MLQWGQAHQKAAASNADLKGKDFSIYLLLSFSNPIKVAGEDMTPKWDSLQRATNADKKAINPKPVTQAAGELRGLLADGSDWNPANSKRLWSEL